MLKQRIFTALILLPLVLWLLIFANTIAFQTACVFIIGMIGWEWSLLMGFVDRRRRLFVTLIFLLFTCRLYFYPEVQIPMTHFAIVVLLLMLPAIIFYPKYNKVWSRPIVVGFIGILLCQAFALNVLFLRETALPSLLYVLVLVWVADISAYFIGKAFGKHRLIPSVSPGKSVEGLIAGVVSSMFVAILMKIFYPAYTGQSIAWMITAILVCLFSIEGDLLISLFKREQGLKDTGSWLPGHGGLLDRIDSVIAAVIVFAALNGYFVSQIGTLT